MCCSHEVLEKVLGSEPQGQGLSMGITALSAALGWPSAITNLLLCLQVTIRVEGKVLSSLYSMMQTHPVSISGKLSFPQALIRVSYRGVFKKRSQVGLRPWHWVQCKTWNFLLKQVIEKMSSSFLIKANWICCSFFWKRGYKPALRKNKQPLI